MVKLANCNFRKVEKLSKKKKQEESIEKQLWKAADKLRKNIDAAEYKHVVMGLVFLKYIDKKRQIKKYHNKLSLQLKLLMN